MKTIMFALYISVVCFLGCTETTKRNNNSTDNSTPTQQTSTKAEATQMDAAIVSYLQIKNALTNDDGNAAAKAAKDLNQELKDYGASQLSEQQKKVYADVQEEALEHSEHIGKNAGSIDHQRSHFDMLSVVMYDLVKSNKINTVLYKQYCPMYNDKKGGLWLSETKAIKNPFYGKKMIDCGETKEEIK